MASKRPTFLKSYFRFASEIIEVKPWRLFPFWLALGLAIGGVAAWFMPAVFWSNENWGVSTTVYSGFLAFNGLLLALGWNAFSKSYEIISTGEFAQFLRRNNLLLEHLFFIDLVHNALVLSVIASGFGLITLMLPLELRYDRIILVAVVGLSFFALTKALSAIRVMNDLIWEKAHYVPLGDQHLRTVDRQGQAS